MNHVTYFRLQIVIALTIIGFIILVTTSAFAQAAVEEQLRNSGFSEEMIQKIMTRREQEKMRETINPAVRKVESAPPSSESSAGSTTTTMSTSTAPGAGTTRGGKKTSGVISIEELYGGNLYTEDEKDITAIRRKEERTYFPGVIGSSIGGLTGLIYTTTANTLHKGEYNLGGYMVYNTINKQNGDKVSFLSNEYANQFYFPVVATVGLLENFEIGFVFPGQSWKIYCQNMTPADDASSGMGDVQFRMKYRLPLQAESNSGVAIGFGAKFPTADRKEMYPMGATGEADFDLFAALTQKLTKANTHFNVGYIFTGDPAGTKNNQKLYIDDKFYYNIGVDFSRTDDLTLTFELNGENWGAMGSKLDFTPGIRSLVKEDMIINAALPISFYNDQEYGYTFKFILGTTYVF